MNKVDAVLVLSIMRLKNTQYGPRLSRPNPASASYHKFDAEVDAEVDAEWGWGGTTAHPKKTAVCA